MTGPRRGSRRSNEAYEVLGDEEKRGKYDQYGSAWDNVQSGGQVPPGFENFSFDFGGGRGPDMGSSGFSSFFEMLFGGSPQGGGRHGGPAFGMRGSDVESVLNLSVEEAARGGSRQVHVQIPGQAAQAISVKLPVGMREGQKIRLSGKGAPGPGWRPRRRPLPEGRAEPGLALPAGGE